MAIFAPPEKWGVLTLATMACARGKGLTSAGTFAARFRHRNQIERAVQLRFRQHLFLPANFAHGFSSFRTFLGDLRGAIVADLRDETRRSATIAPQRSPRKEIGRAHV